MMTILDKLYDFSLTLDEKTMVEIYGNDMGHWLWTKYYAIYHHDLLSWYGYLDGENREKLVAYLDQPTERL